MGYELIITEKPSSARKVTEALADGKPAKKNNGGAPYYEFTHNGKHVIVACAVGHLFTVTEKDGGEWTYPVFETEWVQSAKVQKGADYTKQYASTIKKLAKDAESFTIATDYDIEGEVIGYQIVKHLCKQKDASRMKFSTLTKPDLIKSYNGRATTLNWKQVNAGVTRHELDWYYGINLSRALSLAVRKAGQFKILSAGRVQGPALKIIVDKEKEISAFISEPYWTLTADVQTSEGPVEATYKEEKIFEKEKAATIEQESKGHNAIVDAVTEREFTQKQPAPFDLTTLQTEGYRAFGISPKDVLAIAQELYTDGWISYPRTSSQKLPKELNLPSLIEQLGRQEKYAPLTKKLLDKKWTTPHEGKKTDEAHPAIHPTGLHPMNLSQYQVKIYDLIVRRFLACFADEAKRATMTVTFDINKHPYITKGTRTVHKGWHEFYGQYANFEDQTLPELTEKESCNVNKITNEQKDTKPPKRYTPASIIKELEKKGLGTKATRAAIVENLYDRGYVADKSLKATELGIKTAGILEKYLPEIMDEKLTREFEEELEHIRTKESSSEEVLTEARKVLTKTLTEFKSKQEEIGKELLDATRLAQERAATTVGCPSCRKEGREKGMLMIRKGKFGRFLGCSNHPDCTFTYNLPDKGIIKASGKFDEETGQELLTIIANKRTSQINVDPESTENKEKARLKKEADEGHSDIPHTGETCPTCEKGQMVVRTSFYGTFLACNQYPKCRTTRGVKKNDDGTYTVGPAVVGKAKTTKKKTTKKATKKTTKKTTKKAAKKTTKKTTKKAAKKTTKKT